MAVGAGADPALTAAEDARVDAPNAPGAVAGMDNLAAAMGPAAMAAGSAAAMAAGLGMLVVTAPPPPHATGPTSALAATLVAVRAAAKEGMARVREAAIAWEREGDAADALARQFADAEQLLVLPASADVGATSAGSAGHRVTHTVAVLWHDPADPHVAQLHYQAGGVQNIRLLVPVVLKRESPSYARWRDLVLTLRCYALDDHVFLDAVGAV